MYIDPKDADLTAKHLPSNHPQVVQHRLHEEIAKLRADLAAAQRELAAWGQAASEMDDHYPNEWCSTNEFMTNRVAELLAQEGGKPHVNVGTLGHVDHGKTALTAALTKVGSHTQYREPTIEDAREFERIYWGSGVNIRLSCLEILNQLGFVRKVQP